MNIQTGMICILCGIIVILFIFMRKYKKKYEELEIRFYYYSELVDKRNKVFKKINNLIKNVDKQKMHQYQF